MKCKCQDCGKPVHENHKFCDRCLAAWYVENDVPDDVPNGDFTEDEMWQRLPGGDHE